MTPIFHLMRIFVEISVTGSRDRCATGATKRTDASRAQIANTGHADFPASGSRTRDLTPSPTARRAHSATWRLLRPRRALDQPTGIVTCWTKAQTEGPRGSDECSGFTRSMLVMVMPRQCSCKASR
jgi:hypothetical protein